MNTYLAVLIGLCTVLCLFALWRARVASTRTLAPAIEGSSWYLIAVGCGLCAAALLMVGLFSL